MALSFAEALVILAKLTADSNATTFHTQCLNQAQRDVARARKWPELMVRDFLNTEAAYETGTIAVTKAGTTVTLTGGTWPTTVASGTYRFALSLNDPWYEVATRTDDTHIELADAYIGTTETAASYIAHKPHYSLAAAADRVEALWIHDDGRAIKLVNAQTDTHVTDYLHYHSGPGTPTHYYNMERDSAGSRQVLLGPATPDTIWRVEYVYRKKTTDGTLSLDDSRWPVVLERAKALAYESEQYERSLTAQARYLQLLDMEWGQESESETQGVMVGQGRIDHPGRYYLDNLMGYGKVTD